MITVLLAIAMLFQSASQPTTKPVIDNERVAVWDTTNAVPAQPTDAVVVSFDGNVAWAAKGTVPDIKGRSLVIDLKEHPVAPLPNPTPYQLAFPRPGTTKVFENDRVIVWDSTWTPGVATPMHFHDKDVVVLFLKDGDLKSTGEDGKVTLNQYKAGTVRFNTRNRTHTETLVNGEQRAIITELK